jgi:hypothetical protein
MTSRWCRPIAQSLLSFAAVLALAVPASAQCMPDNLTGPCCQPTNVNLPQFPPIQDQVRYICFDSCNTRLDRPLCLSLGQPRPAPQNGALVCGVYLIPVTVRTCGAAGQVLWSGTMRAHYSRNWIETDPAGTALGVWRLLLNGDLIPSATVINAGANNPCILPPCFRQYQKVYFTGYVDYAFDCANGRWTSAGALDHEKDCIHHAPFSARPAPLAGFHPTISYDFVWPSAGFVVDPANIPPSAGQVQPLQEAFRKNNWPTSPQICLFEEPVGGGGISPIAQMCACNTAGVNGQYIQTNVDVVGQCGSQVVPASNAPLPFFQKRIGSWTMPAPFPGPEVLLIDLGFLVHRDGCNPAAPPTQQFFEGVETLRGYPAMSYAGVVLGLQFEDWGSANGIGGATLIGAPHVTWFITNFNMP